MKKHYYTIGEVGNLLDLKPYVIRYWETEFHQLKPRKDEGRIRKYSEDNIQVLRKIKYMLYDQKYTIDGARQKLKAERKPLRSYEDMKPGEQTELFLAETSSEIKTKSTKAKEIRELRAMIQKIKNLCQTLRGSDE